MKFDPSIVMEHMTGRFFLEAKDLSIPLRVTHRGNHIGLEGKYEGVSRYIDDPVLVYLHGNDVSRLPVHLNHGVVYDGSTITLTLSSSTI